MSCKRTCTVFIMTKTTIKDKQYIGLWLKCTCNKEYAFKQNKQTNKTIFLELAMKRTLSQTINHYMFERNIWNKNKSNCTIYIVHVHVIQKKKTFKKKLESNLLWLGEFNQITHVFSFFDCTGSILWFILMQSCCSVSQAHPPVLSLYYPPFSQPKLMHYQVKVST